MQRDIVKEGVNRRQARIATAGTIAPVLLQMCQEGPKEWRVQILKAEGRGGLMEPLLRKPEQETERVAVARNRMGTRLPLAHQPLREIRLQQVGQCGLSLHDDPPSGASRSVGSPRRRVLELRRDTSRCH